MFFLIFCTPNICSLDLTFFFLFLFLFSPLVFWVSQASFLLTTFKYLSVILLSATFSESAHHLQTSTIVGYLLISLDGLFMASSAFSLIAVVIVLNQHIRKAEKRQAELVSGGAQSGLLSRWDSSFDLTKMVETAKTTAVADKTQAAAKLAHDKAVKEVEEKQHVAHDRLQMRLKKRKTVTHDDKKKLSKTAVLPMEMTSKTKEDEEGNVDKSSQREDVKSWGRGGGI